jgi:hypothetical protein
MNGTMIISKMETHKLPPGNYVLEDEITIEEEAKKI